MSEGEKINSFLAFYPERERERERLHIYRVRKK